MATARRNVCVGFTVLCCLLPIGLGGLVIDRLARVRDQRRVLARVGPPRGYVAYDWQPKSAIWTETFLPFVPRTRTAGQTLVEGHPAHAGFAG